LATAATCIVSLDRKASRKPRAVFPGKNVRMITSAAGTPVLFRGGEELLVELGFEGEAYKPNYVTRPAPTPVFRFFSNALREPASTERRGGARRGASYSSCRWLLRDADSWTRSRFTRASRRGCALRLADRSTDTAKLRRRDTGQV
jgi:hypothetical protein